jgi:hypothetical protein
VELIRQWQECLRTGIEATRAAGEANPAVDADSTAAALIAAIQGGVSVLLSTGSATHLEAALNLCLDHMFSQPHDHRWPDERVPLGPGSTAYTNSCSTRLSLGNYAVPKFTTSVIPPS